MNDTIRKLAQEADVWCDQNCIDHPFYNVKWEQKFAELIVRECVSVLATRKDHSVIINSIKEVKEHFGVEE